MNKLLHTLTKVAFGREVATALMLLRLIVDALENRKVANVARFVYGKLPAPWRHPEGPATESEFIEMIESGQAFLAKVRAVLNA